ncbi:helix-turn-helix domain-containing protein [Actinoallomurus sp. NPDC052308]|uniref:winged helix-turn-helix transcriptional regulator n=1 Tax=Actinoallomurus sp. NPDC052308 TaxID=3155530 RepID=UPI00341A356A
MDGIMDQAEDLQTARCMQILSVIGDLWTLAIVMTLQESGMRFNELQRAIPKVNAVTLTNRLRKLEDAGIVSRVAETRSKQSTVYDLTPFGRKLLPIVDAVRTVALDLERSGLAP